jgi:hypothetical protein
MKHVYVIIRATDTYTFEEKINQSCEQGYDLYKISTCGIGEGINYTAVMKLIDQECLAGPAPTIQ